VARQYDDFGNYTDNDGQFWVGADGTHDGAYFYDGSWHISPPSSDGGGITYETYTSDGSDGFRPGTILQRGSNGSVTVKYTPPAGSSGGGGSTTINYNTQAANDLGPNRYEFRTSDGSDGMPPGTTYQIDLLDGSLSNIKFPAAAAAGNDPDGDGYDNKTGMPVGVTSFGGKLYFQGKEVNPDGSRKAPEPEENDAKTWTGYGPKGQGTYYLDGPGGTPGTYIGATQAPSTSGGSSSGGGNTFTGSGMKLSVPSGSGGGGGGGYTVDPNIGARADAEMEVARMKADLEREFFYVQQAALNDPNNLQNQMKLQQINMQLQQLAQTEARFQAEHRRGLINDFRSAVTDTDPSAMHAMLYAQGVGAGGNIVNRLAAGDNALSDQALSGAAALLQQLRVPPSSPMAQWVPQMGGLGGAPAPGGTGTPGLPGAPTGGVPGAPTVPGLPAAPTGPTDQQVAREAAMRQDQAADAERAKFLTENAESNWTQIPGPGAIPYYKNTVTGHSMPVSEWYALMEDVRSAQGTPTRGDEFLNGLNANEAVWYGAVPDAEGQGGLWVDYGGTFRSGSNPIALKDYGRQLYGDAPVTTTGMYGAPTYTAPDFRSLTNQGPVGVLPGTGDFGGGPTGEPTVPASGYKTGDPVPDPSQAYTYIDGQWVGPSAPPITKQATVPMLAMGGLARTAAITGDPQPGSNRPNPELTEWTPQGLRVTPLNRMPPQRAQALMRGLPRHFGGFDPYTTGFNPYGGTGGLVDTISKYSTPTYTQPAPVQQPTYTTPAPITNTPAPTTSTQTSAPTPTATQPVQQTTTAPTQQPAPQQPVMTGLNTPSGVINTTGLTPEEQALLDEVRQVRESTPVPDLGGMSPYDVAFNTLTPGSREAYFKGMAAKKGIRPEDFQWEVARNQQMMPGLSRGGMSTGY
jgi:hypothetical protein